jgi:hypothetical protein
MQQWPCPLKSAAANIPSLISLWKILVRKSGKGCPNVYNDNTESYEQLSWKTMKPLLSFFVKSDPSI